MFSFSCSCFFLVGQDVVPSHLMEGQSQVQTSLREAPPSGLLQGQESGLSLLRVWRPQSWFLFASSSGCDFVKSISLGFRGLSGK